MLQLLQVPPRETIVFLLTDVGLLLRCGFGRLRSNPFPANSIGFNRAADKDRGRHLSFGGFLDQGLDIFRERRKLRFVDRSDRCVRDKFRFVRELRTGRELFLQVLRLDNALADGFLIGAGDAKPQDANVELNLAFRGFLVRARQSREKRRKLRAIALADDVTPSKLRADNFLNRFPVDAVVLDLFLEL